MSESVAGESAGAAPSMSKLARGFSLWTGFWWILFGAVVAPVLPGGWLTVVALAVVGTAPLLLLVRGLEGRHYPSGAQRLWLLRPFWYLQVALPVLGLTGLAGVLIGLPFGAPGAGGRWGVAIGATAFGLLALVGYLGARRLVIRRLVAEHADLPPGFDGLRIVQLSDLHVGPHTSRPFLARITAAVGRAGADLIVITGDQVDDHAPDIGDFADAFGGLSAPLGVFAIAGNHDIYAGWRDVRAGMEGMGVTVLVNDAIPLRRGDSQIWLAGTGDPAAFGWPRNGAAEAAPDIDGTLRRVPTDGFTIALAHNPALWPALVRRGVALTLSGHTHYGQLSIPRLEWSIASPFLELAMGSHAVARSLLYINPGTNYWGLPLRIGALPEITVVTLRKGVAVRFRAASRR